MVLFFTVFMRAGTIGADSDNEVHRLWGEDGVMNNADGIATDDHTHVSDALLGHRYIVPTIADHLLDDCNLIDQSGCHVITKELIQNLRKYLEIILNYIGKEKLLDGENPQDATLGQERSGSLAAVECILHPGRI